MPNFNAFMHRRNIFRKEPDFKKLVYDYHELKQFMTVGSKDKLKFDFKNPNALRALTCALLHGYFQKEIEIPNDRMIPAVPQRLNYICWIEDLVKLLENQVYDLSVIGIDIGTGASCIFPILSCHRNPSWNMIGIEADAKSYGVACENVNRNYMGDKICILRISPDSTLNDILCMANGPITFIMCNPPFFEEEYGVTLEVYPTVSGSNSGNSNSNNISFGRPKSSSNTSDRIESVVSGGEIAFVGRILEQSRHLKEEVAIYSSMLGRKQSLTHFKQTLSSMNEDNLSWTWAELCQGKTIRYAIAWTFRPGLDLTKAPPLRHGKNKSWKFKLQRKLPKRDCQLEMLENISFLKNLISRELMIAKTRVTRQTGQQFEMLIKTSERTWTHQRRKRREHMNKHKHQATPASVNFNSTKLSSACNSSYSTNDSNSSLLNDTRHLIQQKQVATKLGESVANDDVGDDSVQPADGMDLDDLKHQDRPLITTAAANLLLSTSTTTSIIIANNQNNKSDLVTSQQNSISAAQGNPKKRKNPSSCSSSPSRICPSPNDELTDDDNQSTDNDSDENRRVNLDNQNEDSMNEASEIKRICLNNDSNNDNDSENMDDIYDYLLCCRISLARVCHDLYFELKLEHPCTAASDAYDLFQYFRNKLTDKSE